MSSAGVTGIGKRMSSPGRPGLPRRFVCLSPIIPSLRAIEYGGWHPPGGCGEPRPQAEVHRHGEGAPQAQGMGQDEAFWRRRMETHTDSREQERLGGGHCRGQGAAAGDPGPSWWALGCGGGKQPPPAPAASFRSQSVSWQRKKRAEGQKAGKIGRRRGAQRKGPWEGEGSYANGRFDRIPRPLLRAPAAAAGITGVEARTGCLFSWAGGGSEGEGGAPNKRSPCPLRPRNSSDGGHGGKARTPASQSLGGGRWGLRAGGSLSWGLSGTLQLCPSFLEG